MSYQCIEMIRHDPTTNCKPYYENFKNCKKFWNAVQQYRCLNWNKTKSDPPKGKELEMWKTKLPEWVATEKLNPIERPDE